MLKEMTEKEESMLTLKQVARYLQLSTSYIYSLVQNSKIPVYKIGRQWRFKKNEIDHWLCRNK
jgi:excisionase family DNA binding protein